MGPGRFWGLQRPWTHLNTMSGFCCFFLQASFWVIMCSLCRLWNAPRPDRSSVLVGLRGLGDRAASAFMENRICSYGLMINADPLYFIYWHQFPQESKTGSSYQKAEVASEAQGSHAQKACWSLLTDTSSLVKKKKHLEFQKALGGFLRHGEHPRKMRTQQKEQRRRWFTLLLFPHPLVLPHLSPMPCLYFGAVK